MTTASSIRAEYLAGNRALVSRGTRGTRAMTFTLRGDRIARMVITG